jgi:NCAIR mutase (PurE)-related protein
MNNIDKTIESNLSKTASNDTNLSNPIKQQQQSIVDIGVAKLDINRQERCGFPEFIYGDGKKVEDLIKITATLLEKGQVVLATRLSKDAGLALAQSFPQGNYDEVAKTFLILPKEHTLRGKVAVVTAGTCDLPVAFEAINTLKACGIESDLVSDVGVAAIGRLLAQVDRLRTADVCIVIAGLEGALPSVVSGLVKSPVIAVPTSVGYGTSLNGIAALLSMLNSCANGMTVVNIDNGFGAGCAAARIINTIVK